MNHFIMPSRQPQLPAVPLVALIDLQQEYLAEGRAHYIADTSECLKNCAKLLEMARQRRMPIAHFRRTSRDHFFNRETRFSHWIDDFKPRANEHVFEREQPSCFSQRGFWQLINAIDDPTVIFAGFSGERACLSTAVDAFHQGTRAIFLQDCSATQAIGELDEARSHSIVFDIIRHYAEVTTLNRAFRDSVTSFRHRIKKPE